MATKDDSQTNNPINKVAFNAIPEDYVAGPSDYLKIFRRYWIPVIILSALVFTFLAYRTLRQPKGYDAATKLVVVTKEPGTRDKDAILGTLDSLREGSNVETQVEIVNNPDLLNAAFHRLSVEERKAGFVKADASPAAALDIKNIIDSDVIEITAHALRPDAAADLANAVADEYLKEDLERNREATKQASKFVRSAMTETEHDLTIASEALSDYKQATGLVSASDQVSSSALRDVELESETASALSDAATARRRLSLLRTQLNRTEPDIEYQRAVTTNPEFSAVQTQVIQLEGQISEQSQEFKPASPEIQQLKHELETEREKLSSISHNLLSSDVQQENPLEQKLLGDYADAQSNALIATDHAIALRRELAAIRFKISKYPQSQLHLAKLQQRVDVLQRTYGLLSDRYYPLLIEERSSLPSGLIAGRAYPSPIPSSPKILVNLIVALVLGCSAGALLVFLLEKVNKKVFTPDDSERLTGLAALAFIPQVKVASNSSPVIRNGIDDLPFLEAFRLLRNNTEIFSGGDAIRTIAVISGEAGDGRSTTAINLAIAYARDLKNTLIIDSDLRSPHLHNAFSLRNEAGLTNAIRSESLEEATQQTQWKCLSCLTSGITGESSAELLNTRDLKRVLKDALNTYDVVIIDTPPCLVSIDAISISKVVDANILVVSLDNSSRPMIHLAMRLLRQANAPLLGMVVNGIRRSNGGIYSHLGRAK